MTQEYVGRPLERLTGADPGGEVGAIPMTIPTAMLDEVTLRPARIRAAGWRQ